MDTIRTMLDEEVERTLKIVADAKEGSEEAKWQLHKLAQLHVLRLNEAKAENDLASKMREMDLAEKEAKMNSEKIQNEIASRKEELEIKRRENILNEERIQNDLFIRRKELKQKEEEAKESKKDRFIRIVIDGATIFVPAALSCFWMAKGLQFEETGTFTSRTLKWVSDHFRMFKK